MASAKVIEYFIRQSVIFIRDNKELFEKYIENQRIMESEIIADTNSFCPLEKLENRTIQADDIQKALNRGYGDANILHSLMCLNNSMAIFPENSGLGRSFKVKEYIKGLHQIGAESVEGYTMLADIKSKTEDGKDLMVVKSPRNISPERQANQIHEYFIGAFGTNKLRNEIPNFAYILGLFQCSPPYIDYHKYVTNIPDKTRKALTYCQNDDENKQVNYLLYENVSESKTLREFIMNGCTFEQYLNILVQLVLSLYIAHKTIDFTHYDLHHENVLVRELPEEIFIPYAIDISGTKRYLRTKYVATIIDFGRSHIMYQGKHYGILMPAGGIFPHESQPLFDIYKVLLFSLEAAAFGDLDMYKYANMLDSDLFDKKILRNPDVFLNARKLVPFFYPQISSNKIGKYLIETREYYYTLPNVTDYRKPALSFYGEAVLHNFSGIVDKFMLKTTPVSDNIYGCSSKGICLTINRALNEFSHPDEDFIDDPYIFYEILIENNIVGPFTQIDDARLSSNMTPEKVKIYENGKTRFGNFIHKLLFDFYGHIASFNNLSDGYYVISLSDKSNVDLIFQRDSLNKYREFIAKTVKIVDLFSLLFNILTIIRVLNKIYPEEAQLPMQENDITYNEIPQTISTTLRRYKDILNKIILSLHEDALYVESITISKEDVLQVSPDAEWLFEKMPVLTLAITPFQINLDF